MASLPPVFVEFLGSAGSFMATSRLVSGEMDKLEAKGAGMQAKASRAAGIVAATVGVAAVVATAKAVGMAITFQQQMTRLQTAAGETAGNLKMVGDGIKSIAVQTGTTTDQLAAGMYMIESAGYHGAAGLQILKAAAQGARIENADLGTVANALTSLMVDYHLKTSQAATTMSQLVAAVGHGKTTMQDLATALPNVAAAANSAHVSLGEVAAAIATMTMHGTDAAKAGTYLRQVIGQFEGPTAHARAAMKSLGIDANQLGLTLSSGSGHGLADAIGMVEKGIKDHLTPSGLVAMDVFKKSKGAVSDYQRLLANVPPTMITTFGALTQMTGGVKSMQGFLQLGGENLKIFKDNTKAVAGATADASGNVKDWSVTSRTLVVELGRAREWIATTALTIGQHLIPMLQAGIDWLGRHKKVLEQLGNIIRTVVVRAFTIFADVLRVTAKWISEHKVLVQSLLVVVGVIAAAWTAWTIAIGIWTAVTKVAAIAQALFNAVMDANPVVRVIVAIAALAAGLIYAYKHSKTFRDIVDAVGRALKGVYDNVLKPVVEFFRVHWKAALEIAVAVFAPFIALPVLVVAKWHTILDFFEKLPGRILGWLKDAGSWLLKFGPDLLKGALLGLANGAVALLKWFSVDLPFMILGAVKKADIWLLETGVKLLKGVLTGIINYGPKVLYWLGVTLPLDLLNAVAKADSWLFRTGIKILTGLFNGIVNMVPKVADFFYSLPGKMLSWLGDIGGWFVRVGEAIVNGIWQGIENLAGWLWDKVTSFAKDIYHHVTSFLGINSPSRLFADGVGKHIVTGIAAGIQENAHVVHAAMKDVANSVAGTKLTASGVGFGASGGASLGGGGTTVQHITHVTVQGTVVDTTGLFKVMQTAAAQHGARNPQTYRPYKR